MAFGAAGNKAERQTAQGVDHEGAPRKPGADRAMQNPPPEEIAADRAETSAETHNQRFFHPRSLGDRGSSRNRRKPRKSGSFDKPAGSSAIPPFSETEVAPPKQGCQRNRNLAL